MVEKNIAVLYGDGIGPEIMAEALKVLDVVAQKHGHTFHYNKPEEAPFGGMAYDLFGDPFPKTTIDICDRADAILKGPIGGPNYDNISDVNKRPEEGALLPLRKRYNTLANYRWGFLPPGLFHIPSLPPEVTGAGIDIMIVRELTKGSYFGKKVEEALDENGVKYASDECKYSEPDVERIARVAFKEAVRRGGQNVVNVQKKNVRATGRFWCKVVERVRAEEFPNIKLEYIHVDNAAYSLVKYLDKFHQKVVLTENGDGDILSDELAGIVGSMGLMPTAALGPVKGYYEPAHGAANYPPNNLTGKKEANPFAMINSAAFMLEKSFGLKKEFEEIWNASNSVLVQGYMTSELVKKLSDAQKRARVEAEFMNLHYAFNKANPSLSDDEIRTLMNESHEVRDAELRAKIVSTSQFGDLVVSNILNGDNE